MMIATGRGLITDITQVHIEGIASQIPGNGAWYPVEDWQRGLDHVDIDTMGAWDENNPSKLTVPDRGYKRIRLFAGISWEASTDVEQFQAKFRRNEEVSGNPGLFPACHISRPFIFQVSGQVLVSKWIIPTPGDYFRLMVNHSSANLRFIAEDYAFFGIEGVR